MKKLIILLFSISILFSADFEWLHSIQKAKEEAKKNNKKIMIMISKKDCTSCEYMDSVVFENDDVVDYIENFFIPVKVDIETARKNNLKVFATPTFYFFDKNFKKIKRELVGSATASTFLKTLREYNLN